MLLQAVLCCLIHIFDFLSDIYVLLLWWDSHKQRYFTAGVCVVAFAFVANTAGAMRLEHKHSVDEIREMSPMVAVASILGQHTFYFAARVITSKTRALRESYWWTFSMMRALHSGAQSVPLALVCGIDILLDRLYNPASVANSVKVSSFLLSVSTASFSLMLSWQVCLRHCLATVFVR